jgi:hypothetical protein
MTTVLLSMKQLAFVQCANKTMFAKQLRAHVPFDIYTSKHGQGVIRPQNVASDSSRQTKSLRGSRSSSST